MARVIQFPQRPRETVPVGIDPVRFAELLKLCSRAQKPDGSPITEDEGRDFALLLVRGLNEIRSKRK